MCSNYNRHVTDSHHRFENEHADVSSVESYLAKLYIGKKELVDVKAKLYSVHKLLKKQVSFADDMEAVDVNSDRCFEEDVNFISGTSSEWIQKLLWEWTEE